MIAGARTLDEHSAGFFCEQEVLAHMHPFQYIVSTYIQPGDMEMHGKCTVDLLPL